MIDNLSDEELLRYSRQIMLPAFDIKGQLALANSSVLVVGMGGLGSPVALYLAAAGVGSLTLVDHDSVELSNLQRQVLHDQFSIGLSKVESARRRLAMINPHVKIKAVESKVEASALEVLVKDADVVVDCTDNFTVRFEINRACVQWSKPLVSGAAIRMEGQVSVFDMRSSDNPCYQCLYSDMGDEALSCSESGVMSPLVGIIGTMQALETIKLIANVGNTLAGRLLIFDALYSEWRTMRLRKDPTCACCAGDA